MIDVTPETTARPSPRANTTQSVLAGTNVVSGNNFAQEQAFEQAAYQGGWALSGFWDGAIEGKNYPNESLRLKRDALEDLSYTVGQKAGNQVRELSKDAKKNIEDLWHHRPTFEIPKIQIPKFDIPQMPKFDIPTIPEFHPQLELKEKDIPRLKEPAPKPIPKSLLEQLQQLDLSPCGSISFGVVYATKATGEYFVPNAENTGGYFEVIRVPSSLDEIYGLYSNWESTQNTKYYSNAIEYLESGGGTGAANQINVGNGAKYVYHSLIGNGVYGNGSPYGSGYPFYYVGGGIVEISGDSTKAGISRVLGDLAKSGYTPEIYKLNVSNPSAKDCPIGKPPPPPDPPPDPPKDCDCMAQCCPDIDYRKIQAMIEEAVKKLDVTAAVPLFWQIRHEGDKPQMVIQCAERKSAPTAKEAAKYDSAKYPITVPHWRGGQNDKPPLPAYKKGNWEGILVLADNSKVTINAQNESECIKILNAIKPWIDSKMLENSYFKGGKIKTKEPIKETQVYPQYGRYFKNGQKNNKPDWRVDFL
ncbi:MAG: hypothetical protein V7K35_13340 [Nostoc sp.]|uniref:hypothetical protein n=1 Tax=Nostoc sp. TaxID=1180 RepID=UPI002FF558BF